MSQLEEIAQMAKMLAAIAEQGEFRASRYVPGSDRVSRNSVIEGLRWHVRSLFVAVYSDTSKASTGQDPNRVRVAQKLDDELSRLGNVIKAATARVGPLYFPSEGIKGFRDKESED